MQSCSDQKSVKQIYFIFEILQSSHPLHTFGILSTSFMRESCHVLTLVPFLCLYFGLVRAWVGVGILGFVLGFVLLCVWPGMVPNQRQLSIDVSDWEPYLGSLFPTVFVGSCFLNCFGRSLCYFCYFSVHLIKMNTEQKQQTDNQTVL